MWAQWQTCIIAQTSERQVDIKIGKHRNNRPAILGHRPQPRQNIIMGVSALLWNYTSISELLLLWLREVRKSLCWTAVLTPRFCKLLVLQKGFDLPLNTAADHISASRISCSISFERMSYGFLPSVLVWWVNSTISFLRPLQVIQKQTGGEMEQNEEKWSRKNRSYKQTACNIQDQLYSPGQVQRICYRQKNI